MTPEGAALAARVPKERVGAEVHLGDGTRLEGILYLAPRAPHHAGPQTPLELLNAAEPFYPFEGPSGVVFLPRARTARVAVARAMVEADPERASALQAVPLVVDFLVGPPLEGTAFVELPPTRSRPLDYLNVSSPFFALWAGERVWFVNHAHVRLVRPAE